MTKEEMKAWLAEIDLAKPENLNILHRALCEPLPKGSTRVDRRKRKFLRRMVVRRIQRWELRGRFEVDTPLHRTFPQIKQF